MSTETPAAPSTDARQFFQLLNRQKWVIVGVLAVVVAATVFGTLSLPKIYEAEATLEFDPTPARPLGSQVEDVANPVPAGSYLLAKEWYKTQSEILTSRAIARRVVEKLRLHKDASFFGIPEEERSSWKGGTPEAAARVLLSRLSVKQEKDTRVMRISVADTSPTRAALLANAVVDTYLDWVMEERLGSTVRAVEWLSAQLDDVSKKLEQSELLLHDFRKQNNVLSVSVADQQNVVTQSIQTFSNALNQATTHRIQVAARLRQLEQALDMDPMAIPSNVVARSPALADLRARYQAALIERDSASTVYGPNHPQIVQLQTQLEVLTQEARREVEALVEAGRSELREAEDIERGLREAKQQAQAAGLALNLHEIDYNRLERERINNEKVHSILLQRTAEANLARMLRVSPVRPIDRAETPSKPVRPRVLVNIAGGVLFGLLAGLGIALLRARMDRSINAPEDVTSLGLHVLGLIPEIGSEKGPRYGGVSVRPTRGRARRGKDPLAQKELVVHYDPQSAVAECCRTIRTNLAFISPDRPLRSIVVTSPAPAEGNSTVAASLAIALAKGGRRVLLVDTDLRRPRLHRTFGVSSPLGITSVLAGETTLDNAVQGTIVDDLHLLPCGPIPPNPAELLHTARFASLLQELKQRFDFLLFDSPPVNVVTDAAVLSPQVDGVLLVAKGSKTSRDAMAHAAKNLRAIGANVIGCVVNDLDLSKQSAYGGYSYYYQGYRYSSDDGPRSGDGDGPGKSGEDPAPAAAGGRVA